MKPIETIAAPPATSPNATPAAAPPVEARPTAPTEAGQADAGTSKTVDPMESVFSTKPKEAPAKDKTDEAKPGDKKPDAAPAPDKKVIAKAGDNSVISQIRNAEKAAKAELARITAEFEEYKKKGGGDTSALTKTIEELQKENTKLQSEIGTLNYRKHPDFVSKFEKPFQNAQKSAKNVIESLLVVTGEDADGKPVTRPASWASDFIPITQAGGESPAAIRAAARAQIKAKFGEDAPEAMAQWDKLYEMNDQRREALSEYAQKHESVEAEQRAKQIQSAENFKKAYTVAHEDLLEQNRELFGENPDDPDGNEILKKMDAIIDPVFFEPEKLAPQEFVARMAAIKLRARAFPRVQRDLQAALDKIVDLEARITGEGTSANGKTSNSGNEVVSGDDPDKEMRAAFGQ